MIAASKTALQDARTQWEYLQSKRIFLVQVNDLESPRAATSWVSGLVKWEGFRNVTHLEKSRR